MAKSETHLPERPSERPARWKPPAVTSEDRTATARPQTIVDLIRTMEDVPDSGIAMCHEQGKTAVYLSDDRTRIIEHPPHGPIISTAIDPGAPPRQP